MGVERGKVLQFALKPGRGAVVEAKATPRGGGEFSLSNHPESGKRAAAAMAQAAPFEGKAVLSERLVMLTNRAEEYMSRVVLRHCGGQLTYEQALMEVTRAKAIFDAAEFYRSVMTRSFIKKYPDILATAQRQGEGFATKVERGNLLPDWEHVPNYDLETDLERSWNLYDHALEPMKGHASTLLTMGMSIKDFARVLQDAKQALKLAVSVKKSGEEKPAPEK